MIVFKCLWRLVRFVLFVVTETVKGVMVVITAAAVWAVTVILLETINGGESELWRK